MPLTLDDIAAQIGRWGENGLNALDSTPMWLPMNTVAVTAAYTMTGRDKIVLADATSAPFTVTLPSAVGRKNQQPLIVKRQNAGGNAVTVGSAGGNIDGAATSVIAAQYSVVRVVSDDTNWWTI